jgi:hypothetical protein
MVAFALFIRSNLSGNLLGRRQILVRQGLEQLGDVVNAGHSGISSLRLPMERLLTGPAPTGGIGPLRALTGN